MGEVVWFAPVPVGNVSRVFRCTGWRGATQNIRRHAHCPGFHSENSKKDMAISWSGRAAGIIAPFKDLLKTLALAPVNMEPISFNSQSFFPQAPKWAPPVCTANAGMNSLKKQWSAV